MKLPSLPAKAKRASLLGVVQGIAGAVLICVGVSFWSIPAALVVGGAFLTVDLLT